MLLLNINKKGNKPIYQQVKDQIIQLIESNTLKPGEILPATRKLASQQGLNRITICRAYDDLWALGYIESHQGSYSRVRQRATLNKYDESSKTSLIHWRTGQEKNMDESLLLLDKFQSNAGEVSGIDFRFLSPDPILMPHDEYRKCLNNALRTSGNLLLEYGNKMGSRELRESICGQMKLHSIDTSVKEILITNGTQNALETLLKYFYSPGASIIVESPTYSWFIPMLKMYNFNIIEIPMLKDGMDLMKLENALHENKVCFVYTMPNCHNPTGISTSQAHREKLLSICEKYHTPIVEDGFEEEMKYFGKCLLPLKSMDKNNIVIYLGTFSKILFPGERIGWMCAPDEFIKEIAGIKYICNTPGNLLSQMALTEFCDSGKYGLHIKRIHHVYKKRMQVALKAVKENLGFCDLYISKPSGGYTFWVELLNPDIDEKTLMASFNEAGIFVAPGSFFFPSKTHRVAFRVSIAHAGIEEIEMGIRKMGEVIADSL